MKVAIIGGGASGVFLAHKIENLFDVTIFEKNSSLLNKVKASGNGRGNVSNLNMDPHFYNNEKFVKNIINKLDFSSLEKNLGCMLKVDENNRIYPYFEKSNIICDGLNLKKTTIFLNHEVKEIKIQNNKYLIDNEIFDILVIATGSEAPKHLFSKNNLDLIKSLDHKITYLYPSLSPIMVKDNLKKISGKRVKGQVSLNINDNIYTSNGEILFKDDSLSGICVFELSSIYARIQKENIKINKAYLEVDLFPTLNDKELFNLLLSFSKKNDVLNGILELDFIEFIKTKIDINNLNKLVKYLKHMKFDINLDKQSSIYQVVCGGVSLKDINYDLSSKLHPNLYFIGEVLDIDGICGGYNLHFAFSSAYSVYKKLKGIKNDSSK